MADLFHKQAKEYAETRPSYPPELFQFIASKTPGHLLAWDVATGSGQAAVSLSGIYKRVVATDTSEELLGLAPALPNILYKHTPANMSIQEVDVNVAKESSVDLVTMAQALHWFDIPSIYSQVRHVLVKPAGVVAAWCYTWPKVSEGVDRIQLALYAESKPFWAPQRRLVDEEFRTIEFPFRPVEGEEHTGPFGFVSERRMDLVAYVTYIRSWSGYQTMKSKGLELLTASALESLEAAWGDEGRSKVVRWPIHLRLGCV